MLLNEFFLQFSDGMSVLYGESKVEFFPLQIFCTQMSFSTLNLAHVVAMTFTNIS